MKPFLSILGAFAASLSATAQQISHPSDTPWADTICFAEGTSESYMAARNSLLSRRLEFNLGPRWPGAQGTPTTLSWSLVPDGLSIPNGIGEGTADSALFDAMDTAFSGQGGRATWVARIQQSLDRWEEISGIQFVRRTSAGNDWDDGAAWGSTGNNSRGDIRIGGKPIDGNSGVLAYASFPTFGDIVLDVAENWGSSPNQNRFMRNIVTHEAGHSIGLSHVCSSNGTYLMEPFLTLSIDGPFHDDIRGAQRHYGDLFEPDNTVGAATNLGALPASLNVGQMPVPITGATPPNSSTLSLDAGFEQDWFTFSLSQSSDLTVTVTPLGANYDDSEQLNDGSCDSGNFIDSTQIGDPDLRLYDAGGNNVLASSIGAGAGTLEQIATSLSAGDYAIEIRNDSGGSTQLYDLLLETTPVANCPAPAAVATRTGGSNMSTFTASPPVLGTTCSFTAIGNYANGIVFAYGSPGSALLGNGQVLLVSLGIDLLFILPLEGLPFGSASILVPPDPMLCGLTAYTQALFTGPQAGGPNFQLTNSQDLTLGS